jgi:hypothetical protein
VVGILLGSLLGAPVVAAQFQAVLVHVGLASSPTALTATNGALNVTCQ